jgi:putative transposase
MTWSMDFMSDSLSNGRTFRTFNLVDDYNREALNVTIDTSITSKRVVREPEKVNLQFIARGKPSQNAYVERFNRTYRQEVLDHHAFDSLYQVRQITTDWIQVYNHERPHEGIGNHTPYGFLCKRIGHNHFPTLGIDRHQSLLYTFNRVAV